MWEKMDELLLEMYCNDLSKHYISNQDARNIPVGKHPWVFYHLSSLHTAGYFVTSWQPSPVCPPYCDQVVFNILVAR